MDSEVRIFLVYPFLIHLQLIMKKKKRKALKLRKRQDDIRDYFVKATTGLKDAEDNAYLSAMGIYDILLDVIRQYMLKHNITIADLCDELSYTRRGINKIFKLKKEIKLSDILFLEHGLYKIADKRNLTHVLNLQCKFKLQLID